MSQSIDSVLMGTPSRGGGADGAGGDEEVEGDKFVRQLFESLMIGTKASNAIPEGGGQEVRPFRRAVGKLRSLSFVTPFWGPQIHRKWRSSPPPPTITLVRTKRHNAGCLLG